MQKKLRLVPAATPGPAAPTPPPDAAPSFPMPKYFRVRQKDTWNDLMESVDPALKTKENRFIFEMAASLMAKFRSSKPMNATETKELKSLLVQLGLAKDEDAGKKKSKNASKYFGGQ